MSQDGRAVHGQEVALATSETKVMLQMGHFSTQNRTEVVKTDLHRRFEFSPQQSNSFDLVVVANEGFGEASAEEVAKGKPIVLAPWGRLEGRVLLGKQPDAGREVTFYSKGRIAPLRFVWDTGCSTQTDRAGQFAFDRVMAGPGVVWPRRHGVRPQLAACPRLELGRRYQAPGRRPA